MFIQGTLRHNNKIKRKQKIKLNHPEETSTPRLIQYTQVKNIYFPTRLKYHSELFKHFRIVYCLTLHRYQIIHIPSGLFTNTTDREVGKIQGTDKGI